MGSRFGKRLEEVSVGRFFLLLYAITDRRQLAGDEAERTRKLVDLAARWAADGVDFIQVREKDLTAVAFGELASRIVSAVRRNGASTKVLINREPGIATAIAKDAGADGVHLASGLRDEQLTAAIGEIRRKLGEGAPASVSCHTTAEVAAARAGGATLALFAPVFEKMLPGSEASPGSGLEALAEACRAIQGPRSDLQVLALGGVTYENAAQCVAAGAAGIAAIRLFVNQDWRGCR
jgi:thiamine-phosphate pyrophosphorylase